MYQVIAKRSVEKCISKLPVAEKNKFLRLKQLLAQYGPEQPALMNYSKLGSNKYHCHLSRKWVACWSCENGTLIIEVYYVDCRE